MPCSNIFRLNFPSHVCSATLPTQPYSGILEYPLAHTFLALKSLEKGIGKLELNQAAIDKDLEDNWVVVAEAIQTVLRREGYPNPYEASESAYT
jgi:hypothetical protein